MAVSSANLDELIRNNPQFQQDGAFSPELISFINSFYLETKILLDPIYNAKLFYTIFDLINKNYFPEKSRILIIETGGNQGIRGANQKILQKKWQETIKY